jgi:methionyl-tRNA formyltransferase
MPDGVPVHSVSSINAAETLALVEDIAPSAVLLVSTRLMARGQLAAMPCPVLNLHAGINPAYRGQMGGYWSLRNRDPENFGATVHLVDAGTDTGGTLYEVRSQPQRGDFISTYPLVLTVAALDITCQAVDDALAGRLRPQAPQGPSALHFPPTLWSWIFHGVTRRIW